MVRRSILAACVWLLPPVAGVAQPAQSPVDVAAAAVEADPTARGPRYDLASALLAAGHPKPARRQLELLLHSSPGGQDLTTILEALDAADRASPWRVSVDGAVLPSSNLNGAANDRIFILPDGTRVRIRDGGNPESGIGYQFGARIGYSAVIGPGLRLEPALSVSRRMYPGYDRLDAWTLTPSAKLSFERPNLMGYAEIYGRNRVYDRVTGDHEHVRGLALGGRVLHSARMRSDYALRYETIDRAVQNHLDGDFTHASARVERDMSRRLTVWGKLSLSQRRARLDHNGYNGVGVSAGAYYTLNPLNQLDAQFSLTSRRHRELTPGLGQRRVDNQASVELGWSNARIRIFGAAPRVSCAYSETRSSISLYSTRSTDCALSVSRRF